MIPSAELRLTLDFGRGPCAVHLSFGTAHAPEPAPVVINKVLHQGADITDQLTEDERDNIIANWSDIE